MPSVQHPSRRRRRTPEEAEREIVAAAERFLQERPFREMTVDEVMRLTDLSRPSFYVYFRDRHHLVLRLVETIGTQLFEMSNRWLQDDQGDPVGASRKALEGIVSVFVEHGAVLQALAHAAADDPDVEVAYGDLRRSFVTATAERIEQQVAGGQVRPIDPQETARALCLMNEAYLLETQGRGSTVPPATALETLLTIWSRTLYGVDPAV